MRGDPSDERIDPRLARAIESHTPPTTARPDWDDVVRRAPATDATKRPSGRQSPVIWLAAAAAAIAVVTLTAVVRNTSPSPVGTAAPPIAPARVDWGMTATLRVQPDPGVPMAEARDGLIAALRARAGQRDIAGFEATAVSDGTIRIRVPAAEDENQFVELTRFDRFEVVDSDATIVGTGNTIEKLGEIAQGSPSSDGGTRYWLASSTNQLFPPVGFPTEAEARRERTFHPTGPVHPVALPSALTAASLQAPDTKPTYALLRDERLAASRDVMAIRADGRDVRVTLRPEALQRVRAANSLALAVTDAGGRVTVYAQTTHVQGGELLIGTSTERTARSLIYSAAQPGVEGTVEIITTARYGSRPMPIGTAFTPTKATTSFRDPLGTGFKELTWTLVDVNDHDPTFGAVKLLVGTRNDDASELFLLGTKSQVPVMGSTCERGLGAPIIQVCGLSHPAGSEPGVVHVTYIGQTAPEVTGVSIRFPRGTTGQGEAGNGWFVVSATIKGDDAITDPTFTATTGEGVAFEGTPPSGSVPWNTVSLATLHQVEVAGRTQLPAIPSPGETTVATGRTNP